MSLILTVYFTSTMSKAIQEGVADKVQDNPALRQKLTQGSATLLPPTLYVNDGSLSASAENRVDTTELVKLAFTEAHTWLREWGLKTDQVKNELMHFTKTRTGCNAGNGPSITIPMDKEGQTKTISPAPLMKYLGVWFDPHLKFVEHMKKMVSKAMSAAHALRILEIQYMASINPTSDEYT